MAFSISKCKPAQLLSKGLLIGGCLVFGCAAADEPVTPIIFQPTPAGASIYGMGGNGWTAIGDALVPLFGHPLNFTFIDPQAYYHSPAHEVSGSMGLGQRVLTNSGILGGYVFGDYDHSINGNDYWFVSPGIERLGETLDFSANAYIPVTTQRNDTGLVWADQVGDSSHVQFTGHTEYDELVNTFESTGWGADAQVGVRVPFRNGKIYVGGYYFNPKDNDSITGGLVRAEIPINNLVSVTMSEAYDSEYHNTLKAGLSISLGGRSTGYSFNGNLVDRLVDPIQRNAIAVAGGAHNAQPIVDGADDTNVTAVEMDNISFFVPGAPADSSSAVIGDGTYEDPYQGMTQDNVDDANAQNNRNLFINEGVYNAVYDPTVNPDFIVLNNDQLYGRQNNFTQTASGNDRPIIDFSAGGFLVPGGDSSDSFNDLVLTGDDLTGTAGIFVDHESGGSVNAQVNDTNLTHFGDAIDIYNTVDSNVSVTVNNSYIANNSEGGVDQLRLAGYGGAIAALNQGAGSVSLSVNRSKVTNNSNNNFISNWGGIGVFNNGTGSSYLTVTKSSVNDNGTSSADGGITLDNDGSGNLTANIISTGVSGNPNGVVANTNQSTNTDTSLNLTIKNSNLDNNINNGLFMQAGTADTDINTQIINSQLSNNGQSGIVVTNASDGNFILNIQKSVVNDNQNLGILFNNFSFNGDSNVNINGSKVNNNGSDGINMQNRGADGNTNLYVTNSQVTGNGQDGINVNNISSGATSNIYIKNDEVGDNRQDGLFFNDQTDKGNTTIQILNSDIFNNGRNGINVTTGNSTGDLDVTIKNDHITDNTQSGISISSANNPGNTTASISQSIILGSNFGVNVSTKDSSSGKAGPTNITVDIDSSKISNNNIGVNITANASTTTSGAPTTNINVDISNSIIARNQLIGVSANAVAGSLTGGKPVANTNVNISNSIIMGNAVGVSANSTASAIMGATPKATSSISISNSLIALNGVGVSALTLQGPGGTATSNVTIDNSVVAANLVALTAAGNGSSNIIVNNPVLFRGLVEYTGNGTVNFPGSGITPNSGDRVICNSAGCTIANP